MTITYPQIITSEVNALKEGSGHTMQRLSWPFYEPIDGTAVDERREHPTAWPESTAHRTHAQHNV